jgi:hypothetical protein
MKEPEMADEDPMPVVVIAAVKGRENGEIALELGLVMTAEDLAAGKISATVAGSLLPVQAEMLAQDLLEAVARQKPRPPLKD